MWSGGISFSPLPIFDFRIENHMPLAVLREATEIGMSSVDLRMSASLPQIMEKNREFYSQELITHLTM